MSKTAKISLSVAGFFAMLILLLVIFHSPFISYVLKKVIDRKSDGKVELVLDSFHLNLITGHIAIEKPELLFADFHMDEQKNIRVNKLAFNRIEIDKLNVWKLVFELDIIAEKFLVDKPEFWLSEPGASSKSSFQPEKMIRALNRNANIFSGILIRINNIEIHYGSVMLADYASPGNDPGLVDFTILLDRFDTQPDSTAGPDRLLFSDEFRMVLNKLHKKLNSGYTLDIDSIVFNSRYRDLIIREVLLLPGPEIVEKNSIGIKARNLILNDIGLSEIRGLEDLNLRSVFISEGTFVNYNNPGVPDQPATEDSGGINQLMKVLYDFKLDSISIRNFDYYFIRNGSDTMISVDEIDFLMTDFHIDSTMFRNLFWNLSYDDLSLHTKKFAVRKLIPGYSVSYDNLFYNNDQRNFQLKGLHISATQNNREQENTVLRIPEVLVSGLSVKDLQKRKKQHLAVTFTKPEGTLNISQLTGNQKGEQHKKLFPAYLFLDDIFVTNGNLGIIKDSTLQADVQGLNLTLKGLHLPDTQNDRLRLKHFNLQYDRLQAYFPEKSLRISTANAAYDRGQLFVHRVKLIQNTPKGDNNLEIPSVNITGIDRNKMMNEGELYAGSILLSWPVLNGRFTLNNKTGAAKVLTAPVPFHIDKITVNNGQVNTSLVYNSKPVIIKTGFELFSGPFYAQKNDTLRALPENTEWIFELRNMEVTAGGHRLKAKNILTNSYTSEFRLRQLTINSDSVLASDTGQVRIRQISLPALDIAGLDYNLLRNQDSIAFRSVFLDHPFVDVILPAKTGNTPEDTDNTIRPQNYLIFSYDTAEISKLHIKIEKQGVDNNEFFALKAFNFYHLKNNPDNPVNDLVFNFEEFNFYDSVTHHFLNISSGRLNSREGTLFIEGVKGSNMAVKEDGSADTLKPGMSFVSSEIEMAGLDIERKFPTHITASKLDVRNFKLNLIQKPSETPQKTDLRLKLDALNKFRDLLSDIHLDTAAMSDVSFNIHNLSDTAESVIKVDSIGILIEDIRVATTMVNDEKPKIIDLITIDLKGKTQISKDSLYEFQTGKLHYNFPERRITIDSFALTPLFEAEEFFKRSRYQTDRVRLSGREIRIDDIKLYELLSNDHLHISNINIDKLYAELYRDKHYPIKPGTYKPLPREQIMNIKRAFTIDTIRITNSYLKYRELDAKADEPGEVYFDPFNVTAYNITNQLKKGEKKELIVDVRAKIMGQTLMSLNVYFPLYPDTLAFWLTGKTEKLDLTTLNPLTTNLLGIGILKGKGSTEIPYISGTDSLAKGFLVFRYKKLRIMPYNRKKEKLRKGVLSPLISFMINDLVVKSNNPKFARKPRTGHVYFERDTQKSVINYVWKSVLSGLMSTLGFNNKAQRQERKEGKKN